MTSEKTYRLSSIVSSSALPTFGAEGEPIRILIENGTDREVCAVRDVAGAATVESLTADEAIVRYAEPMDDDDGDYWQSEMRSALR